MDDYEAIRQVAQRYCRGVDRRDVDVMKSAYWPDAIDDHGTFVGNAYEFCERVVGSHARFANTMHCIFNHHIEFDSDGGTAHGEIYNVSYLHTLLDDGGRRVDTWNGRYLDRYERRDGEWRIAHRTCVHEFTVSQENPAAMPIPAEKFRQGSTDRANGTPLGR